MSRELANVNKRLKIDPIWTVINNFSENCLQTIFIFDYPTFLRVLSNCMHVDLQIGATFENFQLKYEQISTSRRHLENMVSQRIKKSH